jgi:uncharacterized repeat protein (TIGR03803 family)
MKRNFRRFQSIVFLLVSLVTIVVHPARGQTNFTVLKSFIGVSHAGILTFPEGGLPMCPPVSDTNGVLYGTTETGGTASTGTVFRISRDGTGFSVLKSFQGNDGASPFAGLFLSTNGTLFGTTRGGGTSRFGTIFSVNADGTGFSVLHNFLGGQDGMNPQNALIQASDGALYGVTPNGNAVAQGTIFKINADGTGYSAIFGFPGDAAGAQPFCRLLEGSDGLLYGTTSAGGSVGVGVVFRIAKDASVYNVLYNFKGYTDGATPKSGLIEGSDGVLYGTTSAGGSGNGGTVFKINKDGSFYGVVRSFSIPAGDPASPRSELIESPDGALYGGTPSGGAGSYGALFKLNKDGTGYQVLRSFLGTGVDGDTPSALLQLDANTFCGTTLHGRGSAAGSVFVLNNPPLPSRILSQSLSGTSNLLQCALGVATYDLQRSTNLESWQVLATFLSPSNGIFSLSDSNAPQPTAFYRLRQH